MELTEKDMLFYLCFTDGKFDLSNLCHLIRAYACPNIEYSITFYMVFARIY